MSGNIPEDEAKSVGYLVERDQTASPVLRKEGLLAYFRHSWSEFKKVVWPSRNEAVRMTGFVIVFVAILAIFIYAVDSAISWLFFDVLLKRG